MIIISLIMGQARIRKGGGGAETRIRSPDH